MNTSTCLRLGALCAVTVISTVACSSLKVPANSEVAVSTAAVENAKQAGGDEFAPLEMAAARQKIGLANQALAAKDYKLAGELAGQARADAKLAQGKANSSKAQATAAALQDDLRVLDEELQRAAK